MRNSDLYPEDNTLDVIYICLRIYSYVSSILPFFLKKFLLEVISMFYKFNRVNTRDKFFPDSIGIAILASMIRDVDRIRFFPSRIYKSSVDISIYPYEPIIKLRVEVWI